MQVHKYYLSIAFLAHLTFNSCTDTIKNYTKVFTSNYQAEVILSEHQDNQRAQFLKLLVKMIPIFHMYDKHHFALFSWKQEAFIRWGKVIKVLDATDWQHLETIYNVLRQAKGEYESDIHLQGLS